MPMELAGMVLTKERIGGRNLLTDAEKIQHDLMPAIRNIVFEAVNGARDTVQKDWPNPQNSPKSVRYIGGEAITTGVSGIHTGPRGGRWVYSPTGLSSKSWRTAFEFGIEKMVADLINPVDYAEHVHFAGRQTGQALADAGELWKSVTKKLTDDITGVVQRYTATLSAGG